MKYLLVAVLLAGLAGGCGEEPKGPVRAGEDAGKFRDPVCHMMIDQGVAERCDHAGAPYYFCSEGCRKKFEADPDRYLK